MTKSLVTGGCGFVGWNLVDALVARGDEVTVIDLGGEENLAKHGDKVKFIKADIRDYDAVRDACRGNDTVFHNASIVHTRANQVDAVWDINLGGTRNIMRACEELGIERLVYVSSASAVYEGDDVENGDETMPYASISQAPYADSKIAAEREVLGMNSAGKVKTVAIRPHVIFGPGDNRFLPTLLERAKAGKLKFGVGREHKLSDFTYIDNLTSALLKADEKLAEGAPSVAGRAFFVTNGEPTAFWDFVGKFLDALDFPPIKGRVPYPVAWTVAALYEFADTLRGGTLGSADGLSRFAVKYMCTHHYFNISAAREHLDWEPAVSIDEGVARTAAHLRAIGAV